MYCTTFVSVDNAIDILYFYLYSLALLLCINHCRLQVGYDMIYASIEMKRKLPDITHNVMIVLQLYNEDEESDNDDNDDDNDDDINCYYYN